LHSRSGHRPATVAILQSVWLHLEQVVKIIQFRQVGSDLLGELGKPTWKSQKSPSASKFNISRTYSSREAPPLFKTA
jgi:hypothetical protein